MVLISMIPFGSDKKYKVLKGGEVVAIKKRGVKFQLKRKTAEALPPPGY